MKKITLLLMTVMFAALSASAQYYYIPYTNVGTNPGGLNNDDEYPSGGGLPAGWSPLLTGSATSPIWSSTQTLPFSYNFNGAAVTSFKVSSSAILTFDVATALAAPTYTKAALPSALIPDMSVCIWGLGGIGSNDYVVSKTFGTAPNRQLWVQFSSYGYGTVASDGSNFTYWSIVLEETSNKIYIVDNRTGGYASSKTVSAGIQINSSTAYSVNGSPALASLAATDPTPADNSYYMFNYGIQPAYDLSVTAISTNAYGVLGNNTIAGTIKNYGTSTITSLDLIYTMNGGSPVSTTLSGLNVPSYGSYNFSHPTPWNATTTGAFTCDIYCANLNGSNPDADPSNDHKTKIINILSENIQRIPLFEVFTSSTCGPCTAGNANFHSIVDLQPAADHASIKYQQDFPGTGDPYATTEAVNRRGYYGVNSIPRLEIDGGWDGNAGSFTQQLYDNARLVPAQYKMDGWYTRNTSTKTYSCKVKYAPLFNASGTKIHAAVIETKTTQNVKSNGETEFLNVMKKMMPSDAGSNAVPHAIGVWDSLSLTWTVKGNYRLPSDGTTGNRIDHNVDNSVEEFDDLRVIAWTQSGAADKQVYQAFNLTYNSTETGILEMSPAINTIRIYPNPATNFVTVDLDMVKTELAYVSLMDMRGALIEARHESFSQGVNKITFNTSDLAAGNYNVAVIDAKGNAFVKQIVIAH